MSAARKRCEQYGLKSLRTAYQRSSDDIVDKSRDLYEAVQTEHNAAANALIACFRLKLPSNGFSDVQRHLQKAQNAIFAFEDWTKKLNQSGVGDADFYSFIVDRLDSFYKEVLKKDKDDV